MFFMGSAISLMLYLCIIASICLHILQLPLSALYHLTSYSCLIRSGL